MIVGLVAIENEDQSQRMGIRGLCIQFGVCALVALTRPVWFWLVLGRVPERTSKCWAHLSSLRVDLLLIQNRNSVWSLTRCR